MTSCLLARFYSKLSVAMKMVTILTFGAPSAFLAHQSAGPQRSMTTTFGWAKRHAGGAIYDQKKSFLWITRRGVGTVRDGR